MTLNPNLLALQTAINTNTLTLAQQAALSNALTEIIPFFPAPDEISNSIPVDEETLARDWMAALYAVALAGGSSGVLPVTQATIVAPNAANLEATTVTGLPNGTPAIVETFGAEFTLQPIGTLVPDGVTVLTSTDPARVWERGDTVIPEQAAAQLVWYVDPVAGNDENTGATALLAVKHKAEIMRRWGSWSPTLTAPVTINYVSADPANFGDPGLFQPSFVQGGSLVHQAAAAPAASFTGSLNAVTPKNVGTNTMLQSTFTTTTGAIAVGMVLVNTTRGNSVAHVVASLGGGNFLLSQPLAPLVPGSFVASGTNVDTWATTDAINGFEWMKVDLATVAGEAAGLAPTFAAQHVVYRLNVFDSDAASGGEAGLFIDGESYPQFIECQMSRRTSYSNGQLQAPIFFNCGFGVGVPLDGRGGSTFSPIMTAGYVISGCNLRGWQLTNTVVFLNLGNFLYDPTDLGANDQVYVHTGGGITMRGQWQMGGVNSGVFGPGTLNIQGLYNATAATPVLPATVQLNGATTGYSNDTVATVTTIHGGIVVNGANLAAATGAAGFGGLAWTPGATLCVANRQT